MIPMIKAKTWEQLSNAERNALVAEKIFNLTDIEWKLSGVPYPYSQRLRYQESDTEGWIPDYCGDIARAMEVVDKIKNTQREGSDEYDFAMAFLGNKWHVGYIGIESGEWTIREIAEELPEAICRAAWETVNAKTIYETFGVTKAEIDAIPDNIEGYTMVVEVGDK